ncbi:lysophospholipid acyltransferase family protein [Marinobacter sp. 1Y8]
MLMRQCRLFSRLILFGFALLICGLLASAVSITEWLIRRDVDRTSFARFCFATAARCLGFRVHEQGQAEPGPVLLVSNHISWSDIPILGGVVKLRFLSKSEVRSWPVIGWLAAQAGTLFIRRGGGQARIARDTIAATLAAGQSVLVFPEGTTSVGITVLPFHSRLLSAAQEAGVPIQPISIGYRRNGHTDHLAPFIGDDAFQTHLLRLLKEPAVEVTVTLHAPVSVHADDDLQSVTARIQQTIQQGLSAIHSSADGRSKTSSGPTGIHLGDA